MPSVVTVYLRTRYHTQSTQACLAVTIVKTSARRAAELGTTHNAGLPTYRDQAILNAQRPFAVVAVQLHGGGFTAASWHGSRSRASRRARGRASGHGQKTTPARTHANTQHACTARPWTPAPPRSPSPQQTRGATRSESTSSATAPYLLSSRAPPRPSPRRPSSRAAPSSPWGGSPRR